MGLSCAHRREVFRFLVEMSPKIDHKWSSRCISDCHNHNDCQCSASLPLGHPASLDLGGHHLGVTVPLCTTCARYAGFGIMPRLLCKNSCEDNRKHGACCGPLQSRNGMTANSFKRCAGPVLSRCEWWFRNLGCGAGVG